MLVVFEKIAESVGDIQSERPAGFVSGGHRGKATVYLSLGGSAQEDGCTHSELAIADPHRTV